MNAGFDEIERIEPYPAGSGGSGAARGSAPRGGQACRPRAIVPGRPRLFSHRSNAHASRRFLRPASVAPASFAWTAAAPAVFVILWSTGVIAAKAGLPYAEPLTFLACRFAIVTAIMLAVSLLVRAPWPRPSEAVHIAAVGLLMHGGYLGGVFTSIHHGLPAGVSALIVGLQPILTATVVGPFLGERVSARQWMRDGRQAAAEIHRQLQSTPASSAH